MEFIPAQKPQFLDDRIQRLKRAPGVTIDSQCLSQTPSVETVGLVGRGDFALTIGFGATRVDGVDINLALEQLLHGSSLVGFNGDGHSRIVTELLAKFKPSLQRMLEFKLRND